MQHQDSRPGSFKHWLEAGTRKLIANLELRNSSVGSGWPLIRP